MADNVAITAGTGTTVAADEVTDGTLGTVKVQFTKIMDGTLDSTNKLVVDSHGSATTTLKDASGNPIDFSATSPVKGAGTAGTPDAGVVTVQGIGGGTALDVSQTSVTGSVAPGTAAADSLLAGGIYTAAGITLTNGQQAALQLDSSGHLLTTGTGGGASTTGLGVATTITRPANVTAYTANDVVVGALDLGVLGATGGQAMITSASLELDIAALPSGMTSFRLYLYNVTPPSAVADNAAWDLVSGDRASYLGYVDLGVPVDLGSTLYVEVNSINKQVTLSGTHLFGYLVTNGGYTPAANSEVYKVTLHTQGV